MTNDRAMMGSAPPSRIGLPDRGVQFIFPKRELGAFRLAGVLMLVLPILFALTPISMAVNSFRDEGPLIFAIFPLLFLIPISIPMLLGLFVLGGHSEITLKRGQLQYAERFGLFHKRWTRTLDDVTGLRLASGSEMESRRTGGQLPAGLKDLAAIAATSANNKTMIMAMGYPRAMLLPIAQELAEHAGRFRGEPWPVETKLPTDPDDADNTDDLDDADAAPVSLDDLPDPPANATAKLQRDGDNLTIHIPPAGLWRGSKGLFGFAIAWCAFMVVFTGIASSTVFSKGFGSDAMIFGAFSLVFWAIGIGMLIAAINMGKRQAIIDIIGNTLLISRQSMFGTKQDEWQADQIKRITVAPSGTVVNNKPVLNLQIITHDDQNTGMFSERADDELKWIARVLKIGLRLCAVSS